MQWFSKVFATFLHFSGLGYHRIPLLKKNTLMIKVKNFLSSSKFVTQIPVIPESSKINIQF